MLSLPVFQQLQAENEAIIDFAHDTTLNIMYKSDVIHKTGST